MVKRIVSVGLAGLLSACCWMAPAMAQSENARTLTVTGAGSTLVETAIAVVRLGVSVTGTSAAEVQTQVAEQSNRLVAKLQQLEVQKLQTTGISLYPQYDPQYDPARSDNPPAKIQGENSVQFEVSIDKAGSILDEAVAAGATRIDSVSFKATETVAASGREAALKLAVQDAMTQADIVLKELNLTRQSIRSVQVNSSSTPPGPIPLEAAALRADQAATPVLGGDQMVDATVTVTVQY
jgi:hypothetical protein